MKELKLNAVLNSIKTVTTMLFPLITVPYLSRVLGAVGYGKVNFSISVVSYFVLLAGCGFSTYAIREGSRVREDKVAITVFSNEIFTLNILTTVISLISLFGVLLISRRLDAYRNIILILSINIVFITLGADWINSIYEDYLYITIRYISFQLISLVLMFVFVHDPDDLIVYTIIHLLSQIGANVFNIFHVRKYAKLSILVTPQMKRHIKPVLILFVTSLATTIYVNSDITILGLIKGDESTGIYSVASRIYSVAKQVALASTIVTIPRLSAYLGKKDQESYNKLLNNIANLMISLAIPLFVGLFMESKNVISVIGGTEYISGYTTLRVLSLASIFSIIAFYFAQCILIPNLCESKFLRATIVSAAINIILNFIIIPYLGHMGAAITTLISESAVMIMCIYYARNYHTIHIEGKSVYSTIVASIFIIISCLVFNKLVSSPFLSVFIAAIVSFAGYIGIMLLMKNESVLRMIPLKTLKNKLISKKE